MRKKSESMFRVLAIVSLAICFAALKFSITPVVIWTAAGSVATSCFMITRAIVRMANIAEALEPAFEEYAGKGNIYVG